jgi:hypothetical protein
MERFGDFRLSRANPDRDGSDGRIPVEPVGLLLSSTGQALGGAMALFAKTFIATATFAGLLLTASAQTSNEPVGATNVCGERNDLVQRLSAEFKENQAAVGMLHETAILEVFVSDVGSWTILATGTDGRSCVLAAGQDWETAITSIGKAGA